MLKSAQIPTIVELIAMGAKDRPVVVTTTELAEKLGKSQQLASKHLEEFEKEGLVERIRSNGKTYVKLTKKGIMEAAALHKILKDAFEGTSDSVEIEGTIFSGLGEGAYYVSMPGYKKQFASQLGFEPFPGTLNLRLRKAIDRKARRDLDLTKGIHIEGFEDGKRTYGGAECFRAILNGKVKAAVLVLERTSHDDSVMEIISPVNVKHTLHLKESDSIRAEVFLASKNQS
ncbi:MAG: DUF120 domain-containing protein [Nitrososphaerales archaeon]